MGIGLVAFVQNLQRTMRRIDGDGIPRVGIEKRARARKFSGAIKFTTYRDVAGRFEASVPASWSVEVSRDGDHVLMTSEQVGTFVEIDVWPAASEAPVLEAHRKAGARVRVLRETRLGREGTMRVGHRGFSFTLRTYQAERGTITLLCADLDDATQSALGIRLERFVLGRVRKSFKVL